MKSSNLQQKEKSFLKSPGFRIIWDYLQVIIVAFLLVFGFIRPFVVEAYEIPSGSMRDTLLEGDRILVCKFMYGLKIPFLEEKIFDFHQPQRGDVFVFTPPHSRSENFVKRIVAVEGDTVETRGKILYVNGEPIDDSKYVKHILPLYPSDDFPPFQLQRIPDNQQRRLAEEQLECITDGDYLLSYHNFKRKFPTSNPFVVPKGYVFAMGDNRDNSSDSRAWGPVRVDDIKGQAFMIFWSREPDGVKLWEFWRWPKWLGNIRITRIGKITTSQFNGA